MDRFLDKVYVLSSAIALEKFMKNPRPYLLPPQPVTPCKMVVCGPPFSGKTKLSHYLADFFPEAQVCSLRELCNVACHPLSINPTRRRVTLLF